MHFSETQYFRQWWLLLIIAAVPGIFIFGFVQQVVLGHQFGDKPMSNMGLSIACLLSFLFVFFFMAVHLKLKGSDTGISYRFFPFTGEREIKWEEMNKVYIRKYRAMMEYGGWGMKRGLSGRGYTISGNMGLQIELKNGRKILLGTQKSDELAQFLVNLKNKRGIDVIM